MISDYASDRNVNSAADAAEYRIVLCRDHRAVTESVRGAEGGGREEGKSGVTIRAVNTVLISKRGSNYDDPSVPGSHYNRDTP